MADGLHEGEAFGGRVDDVGFLAPQRLDHHRDPVRLRFRGDALAEGDELRERLVLREPVRHPARPAAAEAEDLDPQPLQPREGLGHVGHLLLRRGRLRAGHFQRGRQEQVGVGRRDAHRLHLRDRRLEVGVRERRQLRGAELDVVEPRRLGDLEAFQAHAIPDEVLARLSRERPRGQRDETGGDRNPDVHGSSLPRPSAAVNAGLRLHADVLVPQLRMRGDEGPHDLDAPRILEHLEADAAAAQERLFAHERHVLADDDARDAVEQDGA